MVYQNGVFVNNLNYDMNISWFEYFIIIMLHPFMNICAISHRKTSQLKLSCVSVHSQTAKFVQHWTKQNVLLLNRVTMLVVSGDPLCQPYQVCIKPFQCPPIKCVGTVLVCVLYMYVYITNRSNHM
jgi:hypothetical protein